MRKIVVVMDSFKGSLTSEEAGQAVCDGLREALPQCAAEYLPIADGGEGVLSVWLRLSEGRYCPVEVSGPCGGRVSAGYGVAEAEGGTAFVELASAAGLTLVPSERRNPLLTTTYGVGELIGEALRAGCRRIVLGIGGSATNDAGIGLLEALGYRFLDSEGHVLPGVGRSLPQIASIDASGVFPELRGVRFQIICDVRTPFCGADGAACVFAPQKGADASMVRELDEGLQSFARVLLQATGINVRPMPGAGAAGGVGGTLAALLHAELLPGIDFMLDASHFDDRIREAGLVVTGEGHADRQSVMGKVVSGVVRHAQVQDKPVVLLCGGYDDARELNGAGVTALFSLTSAPVSLSVAMERDYAAAHLRQVAVQIGRLLAVCGDGRHAVAGG